MRPFMPCSRLSAVSPPLASFPASAVIHTAQLTPQSFRQTPPPTFPRQIRVLNHLPSAQVHKRAVSRRLVARSGAQSAYNGEADRGDDSREPFQSGGGDGGAGGESGSSESEARRLALDDAARAEMRARSELALAAVAKGSGGATAAAGDAPGNAAGNAAGDAGGSGESGDGGAWKWAVRKGVWDELEARDVARPPRPVHHRIPNFEGADKAAGMVSEGERGEAGRIGAVHHRIPHHCVSARLASLPEFQAARCVKVNPDTPQKAVRLAVLEGLKLLLTPQPRLRTGFFSRLSADHIPPDQLLAACTAAGVARHGVPVALEDKVAVDMVVLGSVAVDPTTGARLGKGEGFAELEYGILRWMGAVTDDTPVVTTVHDCQLVQAGAIPTSKLRQHDLPVDIICTPTQIIRVTSKIPKPSGIYWHLLSPQKLAQIRILQQLKSTLEAQTGAALPLGPDEELPPVAARHGKGGRRKEGGRGGGKVGERGGVGRGRGERRGGEGRRSERKVWRRGDDRGSGGEEGERE
ncbi:unnamed protein product [Closterium sp. Naga37s-1]|nr:unnamed protein product [Closterium sp. Naga37s-1]